MLRVMLCAALVLFVALGCNREPEPEKIVVEIKGAEGENVEAKENIRIAQDELQRLIDERNLLPEPYAANATEELAKVQQKWNDTMAASTLTLSRDAFTEGSRKYRDQVEGKHVEDFLPPEDVAKFRADGWESGTLVEFLKGSE